MANGLLVLRPGALGDTLVAAPALRALRRAFGSIRLAAHAGAARLLAALGEVDAGVAFDDPSLAWLFGVAPREAPAVVAWMSPAGAPGLHDALLVAASRPSGERHIARYLVESLAPLAIDLTFDDRPLNVELLRPVCTAGEAWASDEILVHPGSGSAVKNWPADRVADTIRRLDRRVRLIVGEADERAALDVEAALGQPLPRLQHVALEELAMNLARCRAYLGNDSGISHLAGLCGARTVVLFGPTSPTVWRPLGPHVHVEAFDAHPEAIAHTLLG